MATRGRKPKPKAIKELEGNPGKRPLPNEPTFGACFPAEPPKWLSKEAKRLWGELVPLLQSVPGLLQSADVSAVELLCESYAQWKEASKVLQENGQTFTTPNGYIQQRPEVAIAQKCAKLVKELCSEFGLTPSSRSRINLKLPESDDGFDEF
jgi:P27 family predicted phage terminase small subunit